MAGKGRPGPAVGFTPAIHRRVVALVRAGNYIETAAAAIGVDAHTLREWMKRGARGIEPFVEFARDLEAAIYESEVRDVAAITRGAQTDWRAAQWRLQVRAPTRWRIPKDEERPDDRDLPRAADDIDGSGGGEPES